MSVAAGPVQRFPAFHAPAPRQEREKSVAVALVLNSVLPGAGSFYAGHVRHGMTHAVTAAATALPFLDVTFSCVLEEGLTGDRCERSAWKWAAGAIFLSNYLWSWASAVNDVKAYNARR